MKEQIFCLTSQEGVCAEILQCFVPAPSIAHKRRFFLNVIAIAGAPTYCVTQKGENLSLFRAAGIKK